MRRFTMIIAALLCLCLCACNNGTVSTPSSNSASPSSGRIYPFRYDSFNDLEKAINNEKKLYSELSDMRAGEATIDNFKSFIEKYQSQGIIVPFWDGSEIELRNREGFSNVSFFPSEEYDQPCIFFHPKVSTDENLYIKIAYIPEDILKSQKNQTASEVIKTLSPNSPNVNNLGDLHKNIYEKTIRLAEREVIALVIEYKDDKRNSTYFVYDDLLIEVRDNPEVWNEEWFSALSFAPCK